MALPSSDEKLALQAKLKTYRLSQDEFEKIKTILKREPRGIEWALFSALWSEHCSYKSSKVHLKNLFNKSDRVLESFGENAGVVDLGEGERVAFKIESHNHPSFIEPYQGAATGVGGILRDIFTMGAKPIALANYLCFGEADAPRMKEIVDGVVRGIGGYGNCVGVPTVTGQTEFHSSYNQNVLVNAMAVGLFREGDKIHLSKAKGLGNWVVYVGAKTGRDGVHGASMASESFEADSASKRPTVQIGDPFYEKLLIESCLEVMKQDLVVAIQDMGAAGLTSSSFEMASKGGVGFELDLDLVPLRDSTMTPEDILLSESQERMLLICEPKKFSELEAVFKRWGLDACRIGSIVDGKEIKLKWRGETLTQIDPDLLVENAPRYERPYQQWKESNRTTNLNELSLEVADVGAELKAIVGSVSACSRDWIYRQYDQRVGAATVRDASHSIGVIHLRDSGRALGLVLGCRPYVMRFDAEVGGLDSVAYPALELACKGFEPLAVTDCLNFGNPEKEQTMTEFVASLKAMSGICEKLNTPIISGNVSFYNETMGRGISPTPSTGLIGLRKSVENLPEDHVTAEGQSIWVLRIPGLSFSGAFAEFKSKTPLGYGPLKPLDVANFVKATLRICQTRGVKATRLVGKYGLAYALWRFSAGEVGLKVTNEGLKTIRPEMTKGSMFREHFYEILLSVDAQLEEVVIESFNRELSGLNDLELQRLGVSGGNRLEIGSFLSYDLNTLKDDYKKGWGLAFEGVQSE